jgi:glycosyltransferase involved in cell wall biosynthesis
METTEKKPKVSVCVVTYNQEKYIRQCLQSVVDQVTNFEFEVIVGDDASTDGTTNIINEFADKYSDIFHSIFHENNIGPTKNYLSVHKLARGEYVAHIDGDDYWLQGKLQHQSEVLDANKSCNTTFHPMRLLSHDGKFTDIQVTKINNLSKIRFDRKMILQYMAVGIHSSKMYRNYFNSLSLPEFEVIDYYINVEQVQDGYACYSSERSFGVYRTAVGISGTGNNSRKLLAKCLQYFIKKYPEYRLQINTAALTCLIGDIKNRRGTSLLFLKVWAQSFCIGSAINLLKKFSVIRSLAIKN